MFNKAIPVLPAADMRETIDFYESKLGFKGINYGNYAVLKYNTTEIHLVLKTIKTSNVFSGCLLMVENIEDIYTRLCAKGLIELKGQLIEKPWGTKEFTIADNNKNLIRFGEKR
jgi:uncharacterized glyoxalase superfamily protein PhnB